MNKKIFLYGISPLLIAGCFHQDDGSDLKYPVYYYVSGSKMVMGSNKFVAVFYQRVTNAAGNDQIFFSGDDLIDNYYASEWTNEASRIEYSINAPGKDGNWFTDDDVIGSITKSEFLSDDIEKITYFTSAGLDGVWLTEDDEITNYSIKTSTLNNEDETEDKRLIYNAAGEDREWFTEDDIIENYNLIRYNSMGHLVESSFGFNAGNDGVLNTSDDTASYYSYRQQLLAEDPETKSQSILRTIVGSDGIYNTDDDESSLTIRQSAEVKLSAFGRQTSYGFEKYYGYFSNPGPDSEWLTSDDILLSKVTNEVLEENATGFKKRNIYWQSGENGIWGDADDAVETYSLQTAVVDEEKNTSVEKYYSSPGKDNKWFTDDDEISESHISINFWSTYPGQ